MTKMKPRSKSVLDGLAIAGLLLLLTALFAPVYTGSGRNPKTELLSNLKQVSTGHMIYRADFDERFALQESWQSSLSPYTKNNSIYENPITKKEDAMGMNTYLSGMSKTEIVDPHAVILHYPSDRPRPNAFGEADDLWTSPQGERILSYADGHAGVSKKGVILLAKNWKP